MPTDYNAIAVEYKRSKHQPWRKHVEAFTLLELAGDVAGKAVIDLACGEGFYTRLLRRKGAAAVTGVDLSTGMIELARREEENNPLGITYRVGDVERIDPKADFDLVVAAYLLNYARTRGELRQMCRVAHDSLKPGCRFVTVNNNPADPPENFGCGRPYGFVKTLSGDLREGAPVTYTLFLEEGSFDIVNYYLSVAVHEWAFREAGFREVRWLPPRLSPEGEAEYGRAYWAPLLERPPVIFIECVK
jgi:SAM-dependent methyltransferase